MIDVLLDGLGYDKHTDTYTTSNKFKIDVWDFFNKPEFSEVNCLELGTFHGFTTNILSHLFKKVITVDNSERRMTKAKNVNKDRDNITFVNFDLYEEPFQNLITEESIGVCLIDAGHEYTQIGLDIVRCYNHNTDKDLYMIFDDYGMSSDVNRLINEYIRNGSMEIVKRIGHPNGYNFGHNPPRILKDSEGLICKFNTELIEYEY